MFPLYSFKQDAHQCCPPLQTLHERNWSFAVVMDEHTSSEDWIKEGLRNLQLHNLSPHMHNQTFCIFHFTLSLVLDFSCPFPYQLLSISQFTLEDFPAISHHSSLHSPALPDLKVQGTDFSSCVWTAVGGVAAEILLDLQYGQCGLYALKNKILREILEPS